MAYRPQLDASLIVQKGEARAVSPAEAVEQGRGGADHQTQEKGPEDVTQLVLRPAVRAVVQRSALTIRVPLDIAAGLKAATYYTGETQQMLVEQWVREGLDRWNPAWRSVIPGSD